MLEAHGKLICSGVMEPLTLYGSFLVTRTLGLVNPCLIAVEHGGAGSVIVTCPYFGFIFPEIKKQSLSLAKIPYLASFYKCSFSSGVDVLYSNMLQLFIMVYFCQL